MKHAAVITLDFELICFTFESRDDFLEWSLFSQISCVAQNLFNCHPARLLASLRSIEGGSLKWFLLEPYYDADSPFARSQKFPLKLSCRNKMMGRLYMELFRGLSFSIKTEKAYVIPQPKERSSARHDGQDQTHKGKDWNNDGKGCHPRLGTAMWYHGCFIGVQGKECRRRFQSRLRRMKIVHATPPRLPTKCKGNTVRSKYTCQNSNG